MKAPDTRRCDSGAVARGRETGPAGAGVVDELEPVLRRKIVGAARERLRAHRTGRERASANALGEPVPDAKRVRDAGATRTGVDGDVVANGAGRLRIPTGRGLPRFGIVGDGLKRVLVRGALQARRGGNERESDNTESSFHSYPH